MITKSFPSVLLLLLALVAGCKSEKTPSTTLLEDWVKRQYIERLGSDYMVSDMKIEETTPSESEASLLGSTGHVYTFTGTLRTVKDGYCMVGTSKKAVLFARMPAGFTAPVTGRLGASLAQNNSWRIEAFSSTPFPDVPDEKPYTFSTEKAEIIGVASSPEDLMRFREGARSASR